MHKVLFPAASVAATTNGVPVATEGLKGGKFYLKATAVTGTLDVKIQSLDELTGTWHDIPGGAFAQKSDAATAELVIFPGVAETANVSVSDVLGSPIRAVATIGTGPSVFSLGVYLID
jgi:hypothetical protein